MGQAGWIADAVMQPTPISSNQADLSGQVTEVAVGDHHTILRLKTGALFAFGKNQEGQLGLGASAAAWAAVYTPTRVEWPQEAASTPEAALSSSTS